jgi:hypothetical protein
MAIYFDPFQQQELANQGRAQNVFNEILGALVINQLRQKAQQRELDNTYKIQKMQVEAQMARSGLEPAQAGAEGPVYRVGDQLYRQRGTQLIPLPTGHTLLDYGGKQHILSPERPERPEDLRITANVPGYGDVTGKPSEINSLNKLVGVEEPMSQESWYTKAQTELGRQYGTLTDKGFVLDPANMQAYQDAGQHLEPLRSRGIDPVKAVIWSRKLAENRGKTVTIPGTGGSGRIYHDVPKGSIPIGTSRKTGRVLFLGPDYRAYDDQGNEVEW